MLELRTKFPDFFWSEDTFEKGYKKVADYAVKKAERWSCRKKRGYESVPKLKITKEEFEKVVSGPLDQELKKQLY